MSAPSNNGTKLNERSRTLLEGNDRAAARAMMKAIGLNDDDLKKPIIGIANTWTEIGPCNFHLRLLAHAMKEGIRAAGVHHWNLIPFPSVTASQWGQKA